MRELIAVPAATPSFGLPMQKSTKRYTDNPKFRGSLEAAAV